ncbi:serine/threonine protein kinase [Streptomyces sp. NPDC007910]|uniref:serine/threonine protein kinase n=1 Tax=Streptomyces sp. NPDC007910 TaxID=3364790 RepID=UPI0036E6BD60
MDDYAGRVLADRYRLPLPPEDGSGDGHDLTETRAFDTYSGQEVLVRQVPLPEFVDAEVVDAAGPGGPAGLHGGAGRAVRRPAEPVVRRAIEAAQAAAQIPDHPLLDQVFDVFAEAGSLWIVSERVVAARPLAALLAERPLNPYRAAEIGADVLTALRALHAHGWVHRNITSRTVLVCDDGRVVLSGLAVGAAEEALCGYAPVPEQDLPDEFAYPAPVPEQAAGEPYASESYGPEGYGSEPYGPEGYDPDSPDQETYEPGVYEAETYEPEAYEPGTHEPDAYRPEAYAPERHEAEGLAPAEEYGVVPYGAGEYGPGAYETREYGSETYHPEIHSPEDRESEPYVPEAYHPEIYRPETHHPGPYRPEDRESEPYVPEAPETREVPAAPERAGLDAGAGDGPSDESSGGGSAQEARPVPDAYGADPYGKSTPAPAEARPPVTPPTADVRAARAGAIAAYRAGARAAARLGETGALPDRRPVPPESPGPPPPTAQAEGSPEPQWWARVADDDEDDEDDGDEPYGGGPRNGPPPRAMLTGSWSDGPHAARDGSGPVPAGGGSVLPGSGRPALPAGYRAAGPDPERLPVPAGVPEPRREEPATVPAEPYRGPTTRLAAERARQTRIAVVGAVTERWAPEQAGPVHENWRLAAPIGPATDLWALGALLYRAVQGHAPYPEDSAAELVQLVCAEPPAFAEESGPLRPVVESLLRQDPTERPDFEELRGWLRSLVRSAPEPDAGVGVVPLPSFDETRLPIVRRRGELVRRRRKGEGGRRRHKRGKDPRAETRHEPLRASVREPVREHARVRDDFRDESDGGYHEQLPQRAPRAPRSPRAPRTSSGTAGSPRALGCLLLALVLLLLVGAVGYAVLFMPREGEEPAGSGTPTAGGTPAPTASGPATGGPSTGGPSASGSPKATRPATTKPPATPSGPALAAGYALRQDPEGFRIGVPNGWRRSPVNDSGQVRYTGGGFTMIVVPGRDSVRDNGSDPLAYQNDRERELEPWRASSWSGAERTLRVDIGSTATATGSYWWLDGTGREVFVRNLALIDGGRYHVVQVIGPYTERDKVSEIYDEATKAFRPGR